jgi:hypothetical protein
MALKAPYLSKNTGNMAKHSLSPATIKRRSGHSQATLPSYQFTRTFQGIIADMVAKPETPTPEMIRTFFPSLHLAILLCEPFRYLPH